jgi:hypothetical protein
MPLPLQALLDEAPQVLLPPCLQLNDGFRIVATANNAVPIELCFHPLRQLSYSHDFTITQRVMTAEGTAEARLADERKPQ